MMQIDDISIVLLHVQNNYGFLFFKRLFFLLNVHHSFSKLEEVLTSKIIILKKIKIGKMNY
jgi:hypothetical protein